MKKFIFLLLCVFSFVSCTNESERTDDRFTYSNYITRNGRNYQIWHDKKTGREYLVLHIGYGGVIVELNQEKK